jgi:Domain of unknown function (DUF1883)
MNYTHYDLGRLCGGSAVIVGLDGTEANVLLLDPTDFARYQSGSGGQYSDGGHFKQSPARLTIPHDGHWHVVVDLGGFGGSVRSWIVGVHAAAA